LPYNREKNEHNKCNERIQELAQHLELWLDQELFGKEQELTKIKCFSTGGSLKAELGSFDDILTLESNLRDQGMGAGVIIVIPLQANDIVHGVHISSEKPESRINTFTWKLVTQLIVLHMVTFRSPEISNYADCTSAIARTTVALRTTYNCLAHTTTGRCP
jgi:hypothetical protein